MNLLNIGRFRLIPNEYLTVTKVTPVKKHRKIRIQKKWNKRFGFHYKSVPSPDYYMTANEIIGHPETLKKLINAIEKQQEVPDA